MEKQCEALQNLFSVQHFMKHNFLESPSKGNASENKKQTKWYLIKEQISNHQSYGLTLIQIKGISWIYNNFLHFNQWIGNERSIKVVQNAYSD